MKTTLNQRIRFSALFAIVMAFGITLSACGQKGALYMTQTQKESNSSPKAAQASSSAASASN